MHNFKSSIWKVSCKNNTTFTHLDQLPKHELTSQYIFYNRTFFIQNKPNVSRHYNMNKHVCQNPTKRSITQHKCELWSLHNPHGTAQQVTITGCGLRLGALRSEGARFIPRRRRQCTVANVRRRRRGAQRACRQLTTGQHSLRKYHRSHRDQS